MKLKRFLSAVLALSMTVILCVSSVATVGINDDFAIKRGEHDEKLS